VASRVISCSLIELINLEIKTFSIVVPWVRTCA